MNNHLISLYNSTGFGRVVDSFKIVTGDSAELPLADILVISRVLFAVVMVGFMGYFFDRMKQSLFVNNEAKTNNHPRR
jgi:hypothetical protein